VQPVLGHEDLGPARRELGKAYEAIRQEQIGGFADLAVWSGGRIRPTAQAEGHFVRFLSRLPDWARGVLSVNVGSAATSVAAAWDDDLRLNVETALGVGASAGLALGDTPMEQITRWVHTPLSDDAFREFVWNKTAHANTVPADPTDLWLELALARHVIRTALGRARPDWPARTASARPELLPWFNLILGGGAVLGRAPRPGLAALVMLDALQPCGIARLWIDAYHLAPALGAAAQIHPMLVAQVHDSLAFLDLGTSISLIGRARAGDVACTIKLAEAGGAETQAEVTFGSLAVFPLAPGHSAKLSLRPRPGFNAGFGLGRGRALTIKGGLLGLIIDARGRPITLPKPLEQRQELLKQWTWKMGGV
jgi:hypothetical protein